MEFGIFVPSARNGYLISKASPQYSPTYDHMREILQTGEENGFTFGLSLSALRGLGGESRFWDDALESMTMMSAIARDTKFMKLFGSVNVLAIHPAVAARMAVTIDSVSNGRFALNIVPGGWHQKELEVLNVWPGDDYSIYRWEYCGEYCQVLRELWESGVSNFQGKYFQFEDLRMGPIPDHHLDLVCAGTSQKAIEFTTRYADYAFRLAFGGREALESVMKQFNAQIDECGRTIKAFAALGVVIGDTEKEAEERLQEIIDGADMDSLDYLAEQTAKDKGAGSTAASWSQADIKGTVQMATDWLTGTPDTIAAQLDEWAEIEGVAGYMMEFVDYVPDIKRMGEDVFPRMKNFAAAEPQTV